MRKNTHGINMGIRIWRKDTDIFYKKKDNETVRLTSIDHPQIEGKFTATPASGLTNLFYGCIDFLVQLLN